MANQWTCPEDPPTLLTTTVCLSALSKDMRGELDLTDRIEKKCPKPECRTLTTVHRLLVEMAPHDPCDSSLAKYFNGRLVVERLVTIFDQDGNHRGFHAGDFQWFGQGVQAAGRISGMTNVGTHRKPVFEPCQECGDRGVMEGRLCGSVVETEFGELKGCQVIGVYRIRFDPQEGGAQGSVEGTFEGVIVCPCQA